MSCQQGSQGFDAILAKTPIPVWLNFATGLHQLMAGPVTALIRSCLQISQRLNESMSVIDAPKGQGKYLVAVYKVQI